MSNTRVLGYSVSAAASICFGLTWVLIRTGVTGIASPLVGVSLAIFFGGLMLSPFEARNAVASMRRAGKGIMPFTIAGLIFSIAQMLNFSALSIAPVVIVAPIVSINPIITALCAYVFLQRLEKVSLRVLLGILVMVSGVVLITLSVSLP